MPSSRFHPASLLLGAFLLTAPSAAGAQNAAPACAGQLVRDVMGQVCIPKIPKRIVTIEWTYSENLLALGIQPVGMADIKNFKDYVKTPTPIAASVKDVGARGQVSMEVIAALKPDLIINQSGDYSQREQLARIAPTLVFNPYPSASSGLTAYQEMRQTFALMGRITGRSAQATRVLAQLDADQAAARRTLTAAGRGGQTFVLSQGYTYNTPTMRLFGTRSLASEILEQTGLRNAYRPDKMPAFGFDALSLEGLTTLKTQNFFAIAPADDNVFTAPANRAVWNNLDFVKQGRGYTLDPATWVFGGPYSAQVLIKQVVDVMTRK
ncbi:ABC transporter substrate-binding protein [Deinococcus sp. Leaf326]|uniref:ABC transporter substrate-binding protein n=1 Tax=Deinococcus sp. Leaf326 TaxID=1736338 RepID=UPI0009EA301C|nr:iron-siderophore ABC transporter substrate-binding protein [Deinococcus sp. Leaf326]